MIGRQTLLKRTSLLFFSAVLFCHSTVMKNNGAPNACFGADLQKVEQAGDHFVNFVLQEIENTRKAIPAITRAAEFAAERIVNRNGGLLSAGDQSFALEPVWRAGGIAFSRQYAPGNQVGFSSTIKSPKDKLPYYRTEEFVKHFTVQKANRDDVVLLGYENEKTAP